MKKKRNDILTILFISFIFIAFSVASLAGVDRYYSAKENRVLATRPEFTAEAFLYGDFAEQYEVYAKDQFVSRDKWVSIKQQLDLLVGKREVGNLYLGKNGYLFEKHLPTAYSAAEEGAALDKLHAFADKWGAKVMAVPTAEAVIPENLPTHAPVYDQAAFLDKAKDVLGSEAYVDVLGVLMKNKDEQLYYKSDVHWTSQAAFLCYGEWVRAAGKIEYPYRLYEWSTATEDFRGPLQIILNMEWEADSIRFLEETDRKLVSVTYDYRKTANSLYSEEWLETGNPYGFFMDEEHTFTEIHTNRNKGDRLFVIGDSYANCFIPYLLSHYDTIYVLNMTRCQESYEDYLIRYGRLGSKKPEILVLGSVPDLMEYFGN